MTIKESKIQGHFNQKVKWLREQSQEFVFHKKLSDRYQNGIPDNVLVFRGSCYWVELKRPGEEPTPIQMKNGRDIVKAGGIWMWFSSKEGIDGFFERIFSGDVFVRKGARSSADRIDLEFECGVVDY